MFSGQKPSPQPHFSMLTDAKSTPGPDFRLLKRPNPLISQLLRCFHRSRAADPGPKTDPWRDAAVLLFTEKRAAVAGWQWDYCGPSVDAVDGGVFNAVLGRRAGVGRFIWGLIGDLLENARILVLILRHFDVFLSHFDVF
jgi:hypothetical protein